MGESSGDSSFNTSNDRPTLEAALVALCELISVVSYRGGEPLDEACDSADFERPWAI